MTLGCPHDRLVPAGHKLFQLWSQRISVQLQLTYARRVLALLARSFDVGQSLPEFSAIPPHLSLMAAVENSVVLV